MKGKILCPAGCQNHRSRITKAKEILKNPRPTGSWRPLKCIFSGKEKRPPTAGRKPCPVRSMYGRTRQGQSETVTEQDSTEVPKFACRSFLPLRESCWGVPSPNPAYPLRGNKNSVKLPKIFCKYFNTPTLFLPIFELKYEGIFFQILSKTVPLHTLFFSY